MREIGKRYDKNDKKDAGSKLSLFDILIKSSSVRVKDNLARIFGQAVAVVAQGHGLWLVSIAPVVKLGRRGSLVVNGQHLAAFHGPWWKRFESFATKATYWRQ